MPGTRKRAAKRYAREKESRIKAEAIGAEIQQLAHEARTAQTAEIRIDRTAKIGALIDETAASDTAVSQFECLLLGEKSSNKYATEERDENRALFEQAIQKQMYRNPRRQSSIIRD